MTKHTQRSESLDDTLFRLRYLNIDTTWLITNSERDGIFRLGLDGDTVLDRRSLWVVLGGELDDET